MRARPCNSPLHRPGPLGPVDEPTRYRSHLTWVSVPAYARCRSDGRGPVMREHRYSFEMPHAAARIWALFQDYDRWPDYAPMVKRVDVLWPGDADHNGRLRRVIYQMPLGRSGSALELVTDVEP